MTPKQMEAAKKKAASAARAMEAQAQKFDRIFKAYFHGLPHLERERFWSLLNQFRNLIVNWYHPRTATLDIDGCAEEWFRLSDTIPQKYGTYEELIRFANQYQDISDEIYDAFVQKPKQYGYPTRLDDSLMDLCDAMPLAGQEIVEKFLADKKAEIYPNHEAFKVALVTANPAKIKVNIRHLVLGELILESELYVSMMLLEEGKRRYSYELSKDPHNIGGR